MRLAACLGTSPAGARALREDLRQSSYFVHQATLRDTDWVEVKSGSIKEYNSSQSPAVTGLQALPS